MLADTTREIRENADLDAEQKLLIISLMHASQADTVAVLESLRQINEAKIAELERENAQLRYRLDVALDELDELRYGGLPAMDEQYAYAVGDPFGGQDRYAR